MVEFSNEYRLEHWLLEKPQEVSIAIAARAAMRVLPLFDLDISGDRGGTNFHKHLLILFRATNISWATANFYHLGPNFLTAVRPMLAAALKAADNHGLDSFSLNSARIKPAAEAIRAASAFSSADAARSARSSVAETAAATGWKVISIDPARIESQESVMDLVEAPLWTRGIPPDRIIRIWHELKTVLLDRNENWQVWTDWYEARLRGGPVNDALELARVMIPDEIWKQGPAVVNAEIARLIEEHGAKPELPMQHATPPTPPLEPGPA